MLPLAVAGELDGAVVLLGTGDRPPYTQADLPFLEDVAARAGVAVTHLRGFDQQRRIAQDLQRALLPDVPTTLPGLRVSARYVAGADGLEVGGDWWDVHDLGGGRTGVGIGDVAGRGLAAAVVMGQARSVMRTGAIAGLSPAGLLTMLDRHVADLVARAGDAGPDQPQFATAAYAVIDRVAGTLTLANAGHPPMLLRYDGGPTVAAHAPPGPPLGVGTGGYEEVEMAFGPGCLLAAFTDGLVESSELDVGAGIERLRGHVHAVADGGPRGRRRPAAGGHDRSPRPGRRGARAAPPGHLTRVAAVPAGASPTGAPARWVPSGYERTPRARTRTGRRAAQRPARRRVGAGAGRHRPAAAAAPAPVPGSAAGRPLRLRRRPRAPCRVPAQDAPVSAGRAWMPGTDPAVPQPQPEPLVVAAGELPAADTISTYEEVLPGAADRILRMLETQAEHRMSMERTLVEGAARTERLGQLMGLVIVLVVFLVGAVLIVSGHQIPGTLLAIADLGVLVAVYLGRQREAEQS